MQADWEDMTGSTPLEVNKDVVHFTTKVSALFWILVIHDQQRYTKNTQNSLHILYTKTKAILFVLFCVGPYRFSFLLPQSCLSHCTTESIPWPFHNVFRVVCFKEKPLCLVTGHVCGGRT